MHASTRSPPPPPAQATGADLPIVFVSAVQGLGVTDAGAPLGLDLDGVCTCPDPPSCVSPSKSCDAPGGRDLAGNVEVGILDQYLATTKSGNVAKRIADGKLGFVIQLADYNGAADDTQVVVGGYISSGILVDGGAFQPPSWDGHDVWNIDPTTSGGESNKGDAGWTYTPLHFSSEAYVTGGTLVARIPNVDLGLGVGKVGLTNAVLTARISPMGAGYRMDGQLAGRVPTREILALLAVFADPLSDSGFDLLCGQNPTFLQYRSTICQAADITSDPVAGPTAPCDALSVAVSFAALPAVFGAPAPSRYATPGCDGAVNDCTP